MCDVDLKKAIPRAGWTRLAARIFFNEGMACFVLFVWALEIPVIVLPFFRELAQAQELALVPLYQVLLVEFRHEPRIGEGNKHS